MTPSPACVPDEHPLAARTVAQTSTPGAYEERPAFNRWTEQRPPAFTPLTLAQWNEPGPPDDLIEIPDEFEITEDDLYDDLPPMSKVDALEWELWSGVDQDEAEREMLRREAPAWVFLPPGAELAAALENVRPQCLSPMALIEFIKAAERLAAWSAAMKASGMASFYRQRKAEAEAAELSRPTAIESSGRPVDPERSWAAEIGAALHLSTNTTVRHMETALHLTGPLGATLTAVRTGSLTWSKALAISESTRGLSDQDAQAVESHVLRRASSQTNANLRKSLRTQVAKHTAETDTDRHRAATQERTCKVVPLADGMAGLWIVHTADKIQEMYVAIRAMADLAKRDDSAGRSDSVDHDDSIGHDDSGDHDDSVDTVGAPTEPACQRGTSEPATSQRATSQRATSQAARSNRPTSSEQPANQKTCEETTGDNCDPQSPEETAGADEQQPKKRTAEQRRADVVADLFGRILSNGLDWLGRRLPDQHRRRPHIEVLIPVSTLLGLDDDPCELTGYGPIPAPLARQISAGGTWRRLLTDPMNGTVLEASTTRHDPGALVSETLLARHPVCAWPGCNRASRECDRDHGTPFAVNGQTSLAGLAPFCEYHHVIKDTPEWGWNTTNHPDGSVTLTTPTGHRYTTVPP
ncbi:HNH endonuclease signature motif containing protein, partial [Kribbella albertanoniae]